jgi:hypothetical protein
MTQDKIIKLAREAGLHGLIQHRFIVEKHHQELSPKLERFAALVAEATKEKIMDEWWMCVQSDLEHGVKSLNERASAEWTKNYPAISTFAESVEKL